MKKYVKAEIDFVTLNAKEDMLTASGFVILSDGSIDGEMDPVGNGM